jgi:hypothetical protein
MEVLRLRLYLYLNFYLLSAGQDVDLLQMEQEQLLLAVCSTQGDGTICIAAIVDDASNAS